MRTTKFLPLALLAAVGCTGNPTTTADNAGAETTPTTQTIPSEDGGDAITFVSLKVPNMT